MITQNQRLIIILSAVPALLLIPFIAMFFSAEVNWSSFDFLIAGLLLLSTGLGCELVMRSAKKTRNRIVICGLILFTLLLVWAELAVGVFGTPFAGS